MLTNIDLCILCLTNNFKLTSILSKDSDGVIIDEKLKYFISKQIKIEPENTMLFICLPCLEKLNNVYNYKQLCLQNISRLNSFIDKFKSTDEPCSNLKVTLIDLNNSNTNEVTCENEINHDPLTTENKDETIHGPKPEDIRENNKIECINLYNLTDNNKVQEENVIKEEVLSEIKYEFVDEIVKEESEDNFDMIKPGVEREILAKENNEMEYIHIADDTEKNKAQEENVIKEEDLGENEIKFEFVNLIVKKEPEDIYDTIDIKSDLQNDALLNETDKNKESTSKYGLSHTGEKPVKCDVCDKAFNHQSGLKRHKVIHSGTKPYKCDVCNKAFNYKTVLIKHKLTHSGTKPYNCNICDKAFNQKCHLETHIRGHTGEKPYKCDVCHKAFNSQAHLIEHKLIHSDTKRYKCDVCHKAFNRQSHLVQHKFTHSGTKSYKCDVCDKAFKWKSNLTAHVRCHTRERPFKCEICNKTFIHSSHLVAHKRCHTGERSYKCDVCDKAYIYQSHLVDHKLTHSGTKLYKCDICDKAFNRSFSLKTHMRCHTGEKPYKCDLCDRAFNQKGHLDKHKHCHTGENL